MLISYNVRIRAFSSSYFLPKISPYFGLDERKLPLWKERQFYYRGHIHLTYKWVTHVSYLHIHKGKGIWNLAYKEFWKSKINHFICMSLSVLTYSPTIILTKYIYRSKHSTQTRDIITLYSHNNHNVYLYREWNYFS